MKDERNLNLQLIIHNCSLTHIILNYPVLSHFWSLNRKQNSKINKVPTYINCLVTLLSRMSRIYLKVFLRNGKICIIFNHSFKPLTKYY